MTRPSGPPTNDGFPDLVFAHVGPNSAHREFRAAIANAKALAYVLGKSNAAVLQSFLSEADEARRKSQDGHFALGMAGGRSTTTSVQLAVHLRSNEITLIEDDPGGFVSQVFGLVYREVYRVFESFLVELFAEIATKDKRVLYSGQKLTHEEALRAGSPAALQQLVLDQRKADLTHGGFLKLERTFGELGLPLMGPLPLGPEQDSARHRLLFLSAARNIIEHNRSIVNDEFRDLIRDTPFEKDQRIVITATELGDALSAVERTADTLNRRAVEKFGIGG